VDSGEEMGAYLCLCSGEAVYAVGRDLGDHFRGLQYSICEISHDGQVASVPRGGY